MYLTQHGSLAPDETANLPNSPEMELICSRLHLRQHTA